MSTDIYQARKTIAAEKKNGTLINAAGTNKVKSAVFMDNGTVIASPLSVNRLMNLIRKANEWPDYQKSKKIKVYDVDNDDDSDFVEEDLGDEEDDV